MGRRRCTPLDLVHMDNLEPVVPPRVIFAALSRAKRCPECQASYTAHSVYAHTHDWFSLAVPVVFCCLSVQLARRILPSSLVAFATVFEIVPYFRTLVWSNASRRSSSVVWTMIS